MDLREKIDELTRRINELANQQTNVSRQLVQLIDELETLKRTAAAQPQTREEERVKPVEVVEYKEAIVAPSQKPVPASAKATADKPAAVPAKSKPARPSSWPAKETSSTFEEFIGKNLASKVGILVTIVGIFFGARFAIEHNLVSPVVRIVSGYVSGLALVGVAVYLKRKYEGYSAVLMGGGLAVLYFITYTAYGIYGLLPQLTAFLLMVIFTAASVYVALLYDRVIIAHVGLVAAYAIPFLLSDNSGRFEILFSYVTIINVGILVISFRKYWKSLFYSAFAITWLIYGAWHLSNDVSRYFNIAFLFGTIFFLLFYFTFLAYKLVKKERYGIDAVIVLLSNAFIYYGFGYDTLSGNENTENLTGLFSVVVAAFHFIVSLVIRSRVADRALYFLITGLALVFLTIAVPVQFDGNWVTLLWMCEAALLFVVGRTMQAPPYEKMSAALMLFGAMSLGEDWVRQGEQFGFSGNEITPFVNITFVTGLFALVAMAIILYFARSRKYESALPAGNFFRSYFIYYAAILFFLVAYLVFFVEIQGYFSSIEVRVLRQDDVYDFRYAGSLLYSMIFVGISSAVNRHWIKSPELNAASIAGIAILIVILLSAGLPALNNLSSEYFHGEGEAVYFGVWSLSIRYITAIVTCWLLYLGLNGAKTLRDAPVSVRIWDIVIHTTILGFLSAEYLQWAGIGGEGNQYKLGLSILWGVYALYLIIWGIYKKQKHLRLSAIFIFVVTLVKLFVYDLAESGTITKTVSFISLGVILLLVSYLYHRYKDVLFGNN